MLSPASAQRSVFWSQVAGQCGPPNFYCSSASQSNPGLISSPFSSTAPTATTCSGDCQNAFKLDSTINCPNCYITRITDGSTVQVAGLGGSIAGLTCSSGDNDIQISMNGTYFAPVGGGSAKIYHLSIGGSPRHISVVNSGGPPSLTLNCPGGFSRVSDTRYYQFQAGTGNLQQVDITSDTTSNVTTLVNIIQHGICPGIASGFSAIPQGIMGISTDDDKFSMMLGAQSTGDFTAVWSQTLGCTTANWKTGQVWAYCKAPSTCDETTSPVGTFATGSGNCWGSDGSTNQGVHDEQMTADGNFMSVSQSGTWSQGGCNTGLAGYVIWDVGTATQNWCQNQGSPNLRCGGHQSMGISKLLTPGTGNTPQTGPTIHTDLSTLSSFTNFYPFVNITDYHCSWAHLNAPGNHYDDSFPWICAGDDTSNSEGSAGTGNCPGGTSAVYCPIFQQGMIWAVFPGTANRITSFAHTFECGAASGGTNAQCTDNIVDPFGSGFAIGNVSPKGDFFCWPSTMLHNLGNDNAGKPRADAFCVLLQ